MCKGGTTEGSAAERLKEAAEEAKAEAAENKPKLERKSSSRSTLTRSGTGRQFSDKDLEKANKIELNEE